MAEQNIILRIIQETEAAEQGLRDLANASSTAAKSQSELDKSSSTLNQNIKQLDATAKNVGRSFESSTKNTKSFATEFQNALLKNKEFTTSLDQLKQKLDAGDIAMEDFESTIQSVVKSGFAEFANKSLKSMEVGTQKVTTELRNLKAQIAGGQLTGKELEQATLRAAQLEDQIGDTAQRVRILASDTFKLDAGVKAVQGLTGAFSAATGVAALLGSENEDLQRTLVKVQGAMAAATGIQQVANVLNKDSEVLIALNIAREKARTIATAAYGTVLGVVTGQISLATAATAALNAVSSINPFVALGVAITAIGGALFIAARNMYQLNAAQKVNAELNKEVAKGLASEATQLLLLKARLNDSNITENERKSIVAKLNELMPEYNGNLTTEKDNLGALNTAIAEHLRQKINQLKVEAALNLIKDKAATLIEAETKSTKEYVNTNEAALRSTLLRINPLTQLVAAIKGVNLEEIANAEAISDAENEKKKAIQTTQNEILSIINLIAKNGQLDDLYKLLGDDIAGNLSKTNEDKKAKDSLAGSLEFLKGKLSELEKQLQTDYTIQSDTEGITILQGKIANVKQEIIALERVLQESKFKAEFDINVDSFEEPPLPKLEIPIEPKTEKEDFDKYLDTLYDEDIARFDEAQEVKNTKFFEKLLSRQSSTDTYVANQIATLQRLSPAYGAIFAGVIRGVEGIKNSFSDADATIGDKVNSIANGIAEIANSVGSVINAAIEEQIANLDIQIEAQQENVDKALEIAEEGNVAILEAEQNKLDRLEEKRREEAKKQRALAISLAVINTAVAVINALATAPNFIVGIVFAALAAAAGALQIGIIASQQFEDGGQIPFGLINAKPHSRGGAKFTIKNNPDYVGEYEGGEYIHNKRAVQYYGVKMLDDINAMRFPKFSDMSISSQDIVPHVSYIFDTTDLKNGIMQLQKTLDSLPERMPETRVSMDSEGFAVRTKKHLSKIQTQIDRL